MIQQLQPLKDLKSTIGSKISSKRKEKNITQDTLSKIIGISRSQLANIEAGRCFTTEDALMLICSVLHCEVSDLFPAVIKADVIENSDKLELSEENRRSNTYYDKTGKQILEGDLLKVLHFNSRGKKHWMYHVAVIEDARDFPVMSGRGYDSTTPHYRFYVVATNKRIIPETTIIYEKDWETKRLKIKP